MEIVKHHNDINKIKLGTLTERELDIFISLIFRMQEQEKRDINISFAELKELSMAKNRDNERLIKSIDDMGAKLIRLNERFEINGIITRLNLFEVLTIDKNNSMVTFKITETFNYMLNGLLKDFTYYSLKEFVELNSGYSKRVYKLLKQFRGSNWYEVYLETFREIIGVPNKETRYLNQFVLSPILKELSPIFKNLQIIKLTKDKKKVTRGKRAIYIRFEWENAPNTKLKHVRNGTRAIETPYKVPKSSNELTEEQRQENKKQIKELQRALFTK
jgi:plasmid replication initiation protein